MKKVVKNFWSAGQQLCEERMEKFSFSFEAPKRIAESVDRSELSDRQERAIRNFARFCCNELTDTGAVEAALYKVADFGSAALDFLPLPVPTVSVLTDSGIVRYAGSLLVWPHHMLLSLQQVQGGKNTSGLAGINLFGRELKLCGKTLDLLGPRIWQRGITIDRRSCARLNLMQATNWLAAPPTGQLARAIDSLPRPNLFGALHAVLAALMPMLDERARPLYLPALRLNEDDKTVNELQLDELRRTLGGFAFARDRFGGGPLLPELALQDRDAVLTLKKVRGLPVLARLDRDPVQRDLTDAFQRAQCELAATGFVRAPLQTVPLLTGTALPAGNVILALDWPAFTAANPDDVAILRQAFGAMLHHPEAVADRLGQAIHYMPLGDEPYATTYLRTAAAVFDGFLFGDTTQAGALARRVDEMIARHRDQRAEQQHRFDQALACLPGVLSDPDVVAENVETLREQGGLGFRYTAKSGDQYAAFELKEAFPALLQHLGLRAADNTSFREFLLQHGRLSEMSRNVRGRGGNSCSHTLLALQ